MLNAETKRNIDSARNILVGKVPDPKAQVEQITTALIYKFMDDMDRENEEAGLYAQFFIDDYAKYSWRKLMDNRLSGQERMDLYVEAVANIPKAPNIPQLFRDIFKGAFLPFRDPRTLSLFLKEINEFSYDNSENLGNAFEYLLSILGSQGDAGQFRTPRHIIDFIVEVVNPQKNETILDPACGTAGFLISAYKHILKTNSSNFKPEEEKVEDKIVQGETATETVIQEKQSYKGDLLSPDDRTKITQNIVGYDISPDMVKLALVNLYLHGFSDPKIFDYDSLSSDKRWDEHFDVILANPPFMTPKGGISPHKRFSIQANRAEVLFVDYIAEHLSINGRAGIIVPEGIVFQSANAYKNLRKNLIENWGLYAVVSLPSGVFQPYSGVKTSILLMDREFAKRSKEILFLKVENDGFDLGAQRRKIEKNDLPKALEVLESWKKQTPPNLPLSGEEQKSPPDKGDLGGLAHAVAKEKIAENGDYNLTGDRYCEAVDYSNAKWEMVELGELLEEKTERVKDKNIQVWSVSNIQGFVNTEEYFEKQVASANTSNYKIINSNYFAYNPSRINVGSIAFNQSKSIGCVSPMYVVFKIADQKLNADYLFKILKSKEADKEINLKSQGAVRKQLRYKDLTTIKIPLPPLEVQEQIVAEIEQYQKVIDGAKQVVENWKPSFRIDPGWEMVELGEACEINKETLDIVEDLEYQYIDISSVENGTGKIVFGDRILGKTLPSRAKRKVAVGDVLLSTVRPNLKAFAKIDELPINSVASTGFAVLTPKESLKSGWIYQLLFTDLLQDQMIGQMGKGAYPSINSNDVKNLKIPLPPLEVQEQIVADIEAEQNIVNANKEFMEKMEKKVEAKIGEVWGEEI
jgi:type I restriction enzyme M protein